MKPNPTPEAKPTNGSPLLAGIIAGILLAVLWIFLVWFTHDQVAVAAWGIGGLIGVTLAKPSRKPDASLGILAVGILAGGLTLGTVVLAKVLILALMLPDIARDQILRGRQATATMFMVDMTTHRSSSPELQAAVDSQVHDGPDTLSARRFELSYRMTSEAGARAAAAPRAERERVVRMNTDSLVVGQAPGRGGRSIPDDLPARVRIRARGIKHEAHRDTDPDAPRPCSREFPDEAPVPATPLVSTPNQSCAAH